MGKCNGGGVQGSGKKSGNRMKRNISKTNKRIKLNKFKG
jgi:hypothetical protein